MGSAATGMIKDIISSPGGKALLAASTMYAASGFVPLLVPLLGLATLDGKKKKTDIKKQNKKRKRL